jgi:hypothetical protein
MIKTKTEFETMGVLLKEETLQTVEHYVMQNTLVLESLEPFPGYHGENMPKDPKPDSLFLITDKPYPVENLFRISQRLCGYQDMTLDACTADIFIYNTNLQSIRIKGLNNYTLISEIQGCYIDKGIRFMKIRNIKAPGLIKVNKVFSFERVAEHIFKDLDDEMTFYLRIPYHFNWNLFKKATHNIKNNMDNSNFDCAFGFVYLKYLMEFVRVYIKNPEISRLQLIREKYLDEISKIADDKK